MNLNALQWLGLGHMQIMVLVSLAKLTELRALELIHRLAPDLDPLKNFSASRRIERRSSPLFVGAFDLVRGLRAIVTDVGATLPRRSDHLVLQMIRQTQR